MNNIDYSTAMSRFESLSGVPLELKPDAKHHGACPICEPGDPSDHHFCMEPGQTQPFLYRCHRGCEQEELTKLFWSNGFGNGARPADDPKPKRRLMATHLYPKADGSPNVKVERWHTPDNSEPEGYKKGCYTSHWTGKDWAPKLGTGERVLYRLPELLAHPEGPVLWCEGENKVDLLWELGFVSTTAMGGCGQKNKLPDLAPLAGRQVVVLADHDEAGLEYAEVVLGRLKQAGAHVYAAPSLPSERHKPAGYDVVDWIREGHTADDLRAELQAALAGAAYRNPADPFSRGIIRACDLPPAEDPPRIWFAVYRGTVTLLIGETGAGKTTLLYNMEIHGARNEPLWRVGFGLGRPLRILHIDPENAGNWAEGHGGVCSLRLDRIGQGKPAGLIFHDGHGVNLADPQHIEALHQYIVRERIDVCVIDPIATLFSTADENDNAEAARQMKALIDLSRQTGVAILACHHTGKDASGNYGRGASAPWRPLTSASSFERELAPRMLTTTMTARRANGMTSADSRSSRTAGKAKARSSFSSWATISSNA